MMRMRFTTLRAPRVAPLVALGCALACADAAAQTGTVDFVFVAPAATIDANFPGAALTGPPAPGWTAAWATLPTGYKGVLITPANVARFLAQPVPNIRHIYAQLQPGTPLRNELNQVLTISGGLADVRYFLVDDRTNIDGGAGILGSRSRETSPGVSHVFVWPAANSQPVPGGNRHQGIVGLGESWSDHWVSHAPGGILAWEAVALHEGSHTQWVGAFSRWGVLNQQWLVYGSGSHYNEEILGDQEAPLNEGFGTYFGRMHNNAEWTHQISDFFTNDGLRYFVDQQSIPAGWADLYQVAARQAGTVGVAPNTVPVWRYRWHDVPGKYLLFSESTGTAFNMFFWLNANGDRNQALQMILHTGAEAWDTRFRRFLAYFANSLARQLEAWAATPAGQAARTAGTATSSMFPFALIDVLTHCGISDADYQREIRASLRATDPRSRASTDYFNHRAALCARVRPSITANPIRIEDAVREAHTYFRQAATILTTDAAGEHEPRWASREPEAGIGGAHP